MRPALLALVFALPVACTSLPTITEPTVDAGADSAIPDAGAADSAVPDGGPPDSAVPDAGDAGAMTDSGPSDAGSTVDGLRAGCSGSRGVLSLPQVAVTATSVYWVGPSCTPGDRPPVLHKTARATVASGAPLCGQEAEFVLPLGVPAFVLATSEGIAVVTHGREIFRLEEASGLTSVQRFGAALPPSNVIGAAVAIGPTAEKPLAIAWISAGGTPYYEFGDFTVSAGSSGQGHRGIAVTETPTAYVAEIRTGQLNIDKKPGLLTAATSADLTPVAQIHVAVGPKFLVRQGTTLSSNVSGNTLVPLPNIASDGLAPAVNAPGDVVSFQTAGGVAQLSLISRSQDSWSATRLGNATPFVGIGSAVSAAPGAMIDVATTGPCPMGESFINFERFVK